MFAYLWKIDSQNFPEYAFLQYPIIIGLYAAAICFFLTLFQFWFLLNGINRDGMLLAKRLNAIQFSAIVFSVLYALCVMPIIFLAVNADHAPGINPLWYVLRFVSYRRGIDCSDFRKECLQMMIR